MDLEQTHVDQRAARWLAAGRPESLLLSGTELTEAKSWASRSPKSAPPPTQLQLEFIKASTDLDDSSPDAERRRIQEIVTAQEARAQLLKDNEAAVKKLARRTIIGIAVAVALSGLAGFAVFKALIAEANLREERERSRIAGVQAKAELLSEQERRKAAEHARIPARETPTLQAGISGQLIAYSSAKCPHSTDNPQNSGLSPYTEALVEALQSKQQSLYASFAKATQNVIRATSGRQRPYLSTELNGDISLWQRPPNLKVSALVLTAGRWGDLKMAAPKNNGKRWIDFLRAADVPAEHLHNATRQEFLDALTKHEAVSEAKRDVGASPEARTGNEVENNPNSLFILVYSGAGVIFDGNEFIPFWPIEEDYRNELKVEGNPNLYKEYYSLVALRALPLSHLTERLRKARGASIVVIDACFERPFN